MTDRKVYIKFGASANSSIDYLLAILEDTRIVTLKSIGNLTVEEIHWQYGKGWNTIGALLSHMISCDHFFRITYIENRDLTKDEKDRWTPGLEMGRFLAQLIDNNKSIDAYINELKESRLLLMKAIKSLTFEKFTEKIDDYNAETGCNLAWVLYHVAEDETYHRGQISIIKKLYKENLPHI